MWITLLVVAFSGAATSSLRAVSAPEITSNTVITAKQLSFDYKNQVAVFEGDVVVSDPQVRMTADQLTVTLDENSELKEVKASGNVRIWEGNRVAKCNRAIYKVSLGEVVLSGKASVSRGKDTVSGDRITFWVDQERMECKPGRLIIDAATLNEGRQKRPGSDPRR